MQNTPQHISIMLLGCFSVFLSAFFFYLATVVIKLSQINGLNIEPAFFVFTRLFSGFILISIIMLIQKKKIIIRNKSYLINRAVFNTIAVYCFFKAVSLTTVAQANILNMTFPLFIALFSWIFLKDQWELVSSIIVILAFVGVWLILSPKKMSFNLNSLWGLASGISAAIGIIYLNISRKVHDTQTILFFMFGIGSLITYILFFDKIGIPDIKEFKYLFWCSFFSFAGQILITLGFKYITAIEGGIISSMRILLAAILTPFIIAGSPVLSVFGWLGAFLIFIGNVYLTTRKTIHHA